MYLQKIFQNVVRSVVVMFFAITLHTTAHAALPDDEIAYGSLVDQYGDTLLIEYKSPSGVLYVSCTIQGECKKRGSSTPELFPKVMGSSVYEKNTNGTLAVKALVVGGTPYYFLFDIRDGKARQLGRIPFTGIGAKVHFAHDNSAVVFAQGTTYTRYDIATKQVRTITLPRSLAFFSLSPSASFVTGYNYTTERHELWAFRDGTMRVTPSSMQSYLEFSEDESMVAFLEDVEGYRTLYTMPVAELGTTNPPTLRPLTAPKTEVEDYLFVGSTLFFLANVTDPLSWDLFRVDGTAKPKLVRENVSYGDFLKRIRTNEGSLLAYITPEGKRAHVTLLHPNPGTPVVLDALEDAPASDAVIYTNESTGGRTGVLLSPKKPASSPTLFIWLHGGPQRQIASAETGFHPYLSYAVYDELLERLAAGGNYVYKLDYTGSSGYGAAFRKALHLKIGDVEMRDVERAISSLAGTLDAKRVVLIGNSYGGYMALRGLVAYPDKIDGVISINGVTDWYGLIQRIPSSPFATLFNGPPDTTNLSAYFQASVFLGMEDLHTSDKALVVWGENDTTVPPSQSEQYVSYAKAKGVSVHALSFPDEDHILRKRDNLDLLCETIRDTFSLRGVSCTL